MTPQRIAVLRALQLGDMLCVVPALRALRKACPQAEITLIGLPWAHEFVRRYARYVDDFVAFPGMRGFPEQPANEDAVPAFIGQMRERRFDLVLQMHGSGELSNPLAASFGARLLAGFHPATAVVADPHHFVPWIEEESEVLRFLRLLAKLGIPDAGTHLEFPLNEQDFGHLRAVAPDLADSGEYACVHPGSRMGSRRWPAARFAEVATRLAEAGLQVVLTGSASESSLTEAVRAKIPGRVLDLTGRTTLGSLAAVVAGARLVLCNDTGISHIAAAVATPSVVVSSGANARRWAPLDTSRHRVLWVQTACRPCLHVECPFDDHPCATGVTVDEVWQSVRATLESTAPQTALRFG